MLTQPQSCTLQAMRITFLALAFLNPDTCTNTNTTLHCRFVSPCLTVDVGVGQARRGLCVVCAFTLQYRDGVYYNWPSQMRRAASSLGLALLPKGRKNASNRLINRVVTDRTRASRFCSFSKVLS